MLMNNGFCQAANNDCLESKIISKTICFDLCSDTQVQKVKLIVCATCFDWILLKDHHSAILPVVRSAYKIFFLRTTFDMRMKMIVVAIIDTTYRFREVLSTDFTVEALFAGIGFILSVQIIEMTTFSSQSPLRALATGKRIAIILDLLLFHITIMSARRTSPPIVMIQARLAESNIVMLGDMSTF